MTEIGTDFRELHRPGQPFILCNVWDKGTARMMAALGAKSLATSSAAHAFTEGRPDGGTLTRDEALAHAQEILSATNLPVQGDFENGFGDAPEDCADTVRYAAEIGLAGICIEDIMLPGTAPYSHAIAIERIRAAVSAARALPHDFFLTARADGVMVGEYDIAEAITRCQGFAAVGADCIYVPMTKTLADLAQLVKAVDVPVNVLIAGDYAAMPFSAFADIGVARLSLGSTLARAAQRTLYDAGVAMFEAVNFDPLTKSINGEKVDALLVQKC